MTTPLSRHLLKRAQTQAAPQGPLPPATVAQTPQEAAVDAETRKRTVRSLLGLTAGGFGLGLGLGGLYQGYQWARRPDPNAGSPAFAPDEVDLPVGPRKKKRLPNLKYAAEEGFFEKNVVTPLANLTRRGGEGGLPVQAPDLPGRHWGWSLPAAVGGTGAGMVGGLGLASWLARKRREREDEKDVGDAKREFQSALAMQYQQPKVASHKDPLDAAYEAWEKKAFMGMEATLPQLYAAYALGTGGAAGVMAFNRNRYSNREKALRDAVRMRAAQRAALWPPELHVVPRPVEDEEEKPKPPKKTPSSPA